MYRGAEKFDVRPVVEFGAAEDTDARCVQTCIKNATQVLILQGNDEGDAWADKVYTAAANMGREVVVVRNIQDAFCVQEDTAVFAPAQCAEWVGAWVVNTFGPRPKVLPAAGTRRSRTSEYVPPGRSKLVLSSM